MDELLGKFFPEDVLFVPIGFFGDLSNTVLGDFEELFVRREDDLLLNGWA